MGRGLQLSPPAVRGTGTSEETLFLHTRQILVALPVTRRTACGSPVDATCTHRASSPEGCLSGGPHLGLLRTRRAEAKSVKPKKLLRRQPGLHPFFQAAQWKPAPEVLGLAPQAKWVFHVVFQGEGRCCHQDGPASPSSGVYSHKCMRTPCTWLLPRLGATQLSPGQWLPAL